jgi:hypothetical protein
MPEGGKCFKHNRPLVKVDEDPFGLFASPAPPARDESRLLLSEASLELMRKNPEVCECCGNVKAVYRRPLQPVMAFYCQWAARHHGTAWVKRKDLPMAVRDNGNFTKLPHWGLMETAQNEDATKTSSGVYRLTERGVQFGLGRIKVPAVVYEGPGKVYLGEVARQLGLTDALRGETFDIRTI